MSGVKLHCGREKLELYHESQLWIVLDSGSARIWDSFSGSMKINRVGPLLNHSQDTCTTVCLYGRNYKTKDKPALHVVENWPLLFRVPELNFVNLVHPLTVAHFQPHRFTWHDNFFWVLNSYMVHMTFTNAAVYSWIWNDTGPIWINMVSSSHVGTPTKFRTYSVDCQLSKTFCTCECISGKEQIPNFVLEPADSSMSFLFSAVVSLHTTAVRVYSSLMHVSIIEHRYVLSAIHTIAHPNYRPNLELPTLIQAWCGSWIWGFALSYCPSRALYSA